jgi:hypothetical protein
VSIQELLVKTPTTAGVITACEHLFSNPANPDSVKLRRARNPFVPHIIHPNSDKLLLITPDNGRRQNPFILHPSNPNSDKNGGHGSKSILSSFNLTNLNAGNPVGKQHANFYDAAGY